MHQICNLNVSTKSQVKPFRRLKFPNSHPQYLLNSVDRWYIQSLPIWGLHSTNNTFHSMRLSTNSRSEQTWWDQAMLDPTSLQSQLSKANTHHRVKAFNSLWQFRYHARILTLLNTQLLISNTTSTLDPCFLDQHSLSGQITCLKLNPRINAIQSSTR
jgi:hypothetical protein